MKTRIIKILIAFLFLLIIISLIIHRGPDRFIRTLENIMFSMDDGPKGDPAILKVHFIDVGQGDAILIQSDNNNMLIDAGESHNSKNLVNYLKQNEVIKLDYLIGTHPHSDHIGGLASIISNFQIDKIIMPDVEHNTKSYEEVLDAIAENNLKITKPVIGNEYGIGSASFVIIAPNGSDYKSLNDYSVGIKLTNRENSFILTGDAEVQSEKEILQNGIDLKADVLKLAHHGSSTSSSEDFLDAISPSIAVISLKKDNSYGHPHVEIIQTIKDRKIKLYRTDEQGTIILISDGKTITANKSPYEIRDKDTIRSNP